MTQLSSDLLQAKSLLEAGNTCALVCGKTQKTSTRRGVAPLLAWLNDGTDYSGFSAADKVVGKAAAFLYVLLNVDTVYALTVSEQAEKVLKEHNIPLIYEQKVPAIRNREHTGLCPMEQATWDIDEPLQAKLAIERTIEKLRGYHS